MATPHRGTNLVRALTAIVQSTSGLANSKQHLADLGKNWMAVQKLNQRFRNDVVPGLDVVSFYETKAADESGEAVSAPCIL